MAKQPLYQDVYQKIKDLIRSGEYEVGEFLPTESELEEKYKVSRTTIRKVINMLVLDGYIEVKQGRGTSVLDYHSTQTLNKITSISETLEKKGMKVEAKSIYVDIVQASAKTAKMLQIEEGSDIYRVQRVILADDIPTAIMENYISCEMTPGLEHEYEKIHTLYRFLEERYGLHMDFAKDIISAKSAEFSESQILNVRPGAALLTLRRVTYIDKKPLSYDKTILRADRYQFEIESEGRNN